MELKRVVFTSVGSWVARALFQSTFWDNFSTWGQASLLVPPDYFPLRETPASSGQLKQYQQEILRQTPFFMHLWRILYIQNGYRLHSYSRRVKQERQIERNTGKVRLVYTSQRAFAFSLHHLKLGLLAERFYWWYVGKRSEISTLKQSLQMLGAEALVVCGSEGMADSPYVVAAHQLHLPIAVLIRSWDNLSSRTAIVPNADGYILWSDEMARELRLLAPWIPVKKLFIVGASKFDRHNPQWIPERNAFFRAVGLNPHSRGPLIVYACGGTHLGSADEHAIKTIVDILKSGRLPAGTQLLVRMHPFLTKNKYLQALKQSLPQDFSIALWPQSERKTDLSDFEALLGSLSYQTVNVNIASTMTIDSMIFDKPVVNIAFEGEKPLNFVRSVRDFYEFDHYRTIVEHGGVDIAYSPKELETRLLSAIAYPARKSEERVRTVRFHIGEVDGLAGQRTSQALRAIFQSHNAT